jgi:lysine/ornithine N-monooxygenase
MKIPINYFKNPNMADVWIGKYCIENNIEIICLKHDEGYMKYIPQKTTIYNEASKSDKIQTGLVNGLFTPKIVETKIEDQEVVKKNTLKTLELTQKQINYDKINSIFQKSNPKTITQAKNNQEVVNIKLNSTTISKLMGKGNKKFKK